MIIRAKESLSVPLGRVLAPEDSSVKWTVANLAATRPNLIADLARKEADQKFFRGLSLNFLLVRLEDLIGKPYSILGLGLAGATIFC